MYFAALFVAASFAVARAAPFARQDSDLVEVVGTVVVEDGKGGTVTDESGTIFMCVHDSQGFRSQPVLLVEGQWKTRVQATLRLTFEILTLDNGTARWIPDRENDESEVDEEFGSGPKRFTPMPIPSNRHIAIRARYAPPCVVHVVDSATGAELEHVVALVDIYHVDKNSTMSTLGSHYLGEQQVYPTEWWPWDVRAQDRVSPLSLTAKLDRRRNNLVSWREGLWVHAPGYCWSGTDVDYTIGGETTVRLARGGTLILNVQSSQMPADTKIFVRDLRPTARSPAEETTTADDARLDELARELGLNGFDHESASSDLLEWPLVSGKPTTFDALPPGDYRVSLQVGKRYEKRLTLAWTDVTLKAGATTTATIRPEDVPETPKHVPLNGTIRVDPGWRDTTFQVSVIPWQTTPLLHQDAVQFRFEELLRDPIDPHLWRLPVRMVAPGTYRIVVHGFGISRSVSILDDEKQLAFEIAEPIDTTFHFIDARTKVPVAADTPRWDVVESSERRIEFSTSSFLAAMKRFDRESTTADTHSIRVPAGKIALRMNAEAYDTSSPIEVEVSKTSHEHTIPLRHLSGVRIRFEIGGKPIDDASVLSRHRRDQSRTDPLDDEREIRMRRRDPPSEFDEGTRSGRLDGVRYLSVDHSGDYMVIVPDLPGFEPIAPRDVTVADQEFTEVVFELVRKKK
jgi:hypothetical protein